MISLSLSITQHNINRKVFDRIFSSKDLPSLAIILQAAFSPNLNEQKVAEQGLNQFQYAPQHLVRLLQMIVDNNVDMGVSQVASIHFKNCIAKNWSPLNDMQ